MRTFFMPFLHDHFLHLLLILGLGLSFFVPINIMQWGGVVDWRTIMTLSGLMMLTKGVEVSGYFEVLARRMSRRFTSERQLALFMVSTAAILSTFMTNDVALFITVPLTLALKRLCQISVPRFIIFEALAVNAGSLLTPLGNPQNILLWHRSGLTFGAFVWQMMPLATISVVSLLLLCVFCFRAKALHFYIEEETIKWKPRLFCGSLALYLFFLVLLEYQNELLGITFIALGFALFARRIVLQIDWSLLLVFIVMFIDVYLITCLPGLQQTLTNIVHWPESYLFLTGIGLSQVISNVPATILLSGYIPSSALLAYAVNIGGFGLLSGSLANIIALRMAKDGHIWWHFHLYSVPMLLWSALIGGGLLTIAGYQFFNV